MTDVAQRIAHVRERIDAAARRVGRRAEDVTLVAVTKEVGLDAVRDALAAGARYLGENRAQELVPKAEALRDASPPPAWHFVGRLQRNKVRALAPHVALWESVDRPELVAELARRAPGAPVLVQVNLGDEPHKGGCAPREAPPLVEALRTGGLVVAGLMTVPPAAGDPRPWFAALRDLAARLELEALSMGMSGDFEVAVEEGATLVRVGSAIFGPRPGPAGLRR